MFSSPIYKVFKIKAFLFLFIVTCAFNLSAQEPPHEVPIIIIGGGPAGLGLAYELQARQFPHFLILEAGASAGNSWQQMPTELKLLTPWGLNKPNGASDIHFENDAYVARRDFVRYLHDYAKRHQFPIQYQTRVIKVIKEDNGTLLVITTNGTFKAEFVVNATGYFSKPHRPVYPGAEDSNITQLHSSEYRDPQQMASLQKILVVGSRLSAEQLIIELHHAGFSVSLSHRHPLRRYTSIPFPVKKIGLKLSDFVERVIMNIVGPRAFDHRPNMSDSRIREWIGNGEIQTFPAISRFHQKQIEFNNGKQEAFDAVIFATGFRPALDHLSGLISINSVGLPKTNHMESIDTPGLFFLGTHNVRNFRSRFLRGIREDAFFLATQILRKREHRAAPELFYGKPSPILDLSAESTEGVVPLTPPFRPGKELILAFSWKNAHAFVIADNLEFHGRLYFNRAFHRPSPKDNSVRASFFIRFLNVTTAQIRRVKAYMHLMNGHRTTGCFEGACEVLSRGAGIDLSHAALSDKSSLRHFLESIIRHGFKDSDGKPVPFEIYRTRPMTLEQIVGMVTRRQAIYMFPAMVGNMIGRTVFISAHAWSEITGKHLTDDGYPFRKYIGREDESTHIPETYADSLARAAQAMKNNLLDIEPSDIDPISAHFSELFIAANDWGLTQEEVFFVAADAMHWAPELSRSLLDSSTLSELQHLSASEMSTSAVTSIVSKRLRELAR